MPRGCGGLGIRSIGAFNEALLMKRVWRLQQHPQLLASRVYNIRWSHNTTRTTSSSHYFSWWVRGLQHAVTTLRQNCVWKIGNSINIVAIEDRWFKDHMPLLRDDNWHPLHIAASLRVQDFILPNNGGWNVLKVHKFFTATGARHTLAMELPNSSPTPDKLYWAMTKCGEYSTKIGYAFSFNNNKTKFVARQLLCNCISPHYLEFEHHAKMEAFSLKTLA